MGSWNIRRVIMLVLRIALGAVWLYAAYVKLKEPWLIFAMSIDSYKMLPQWAVLAIARTLPWLELALGVMFIFGILLRYAATIGAAILTVFFVAMVSAYARGLNIDCGCFGPGDAISWRTFLRDGSLLAAAIVLAWLSWKSVRQPTPSHG